MSISVRGLFTRTCLNCGGASGHPPILDDGYAVCYPCVLRATRESQDEQIVLRAEAEYRIEQRIAEMVVGTAIGEAERAHRKWHRSGELWPNCHFCGLS